MTDKSLLKKFSSAEELQHVLSLWQQQLISLKLWGRAVIDAVALQLKQNKGKCRKCVTVQVLLKLNSLSHLVKILLCL